MYFWGRSLPLYFTGVSSRYKWVVVYSCAFAKGHTESTRMLKNPLPQWLLCLLLASALDFEQKKSTSTGISLFILTYIIS